VPHPHALSTVIRVNNLPLPSGCIPAGFYVTINADSKRCWKSAVRVVSSECDSKTDHSFVDHYTRCLSYRWRSEYRMSSVECLEMVKSWPNSNHRGMSYSIAEMSLSVSSFSLIRSYLHVVDISFPFIDGDHSSLTLKAAVICPCDKQDSALLDVSDISLCIVGIC